MFKRKDYKEKQLRYSIRKVSYGAASVAIASLYLFMGSSAVSASEVQPVNGEQNTVTNTEEVKKNEKQTEETDIKKGETLDKTSLTKLIEEIDGKFTNGNYTSKTEDSVNQLKAALEAAKTALSSAKTQAELTQAHANLIVATTKLQTKPEEKKQEPAVDTTNGKATVGIKATNTEKASESNSIANSGSRDERNGKEMDKNNPFRTDATTTDTDPAAHQTYTAPAADANLETLNEKLRKLPNYIENNKKVQDMDTLGNEKGVAAGSVAEINEFGGWKAVNQEDGSAGKFAIAKATDKGVFPVETMNILGSKATAYVGEQSFDRTSKYMLFLSEVRTQATKTKKAYDDSAWSDSDGTFGKHTSKAVKGYNGIEKTFKVYSSDKNTKVNLEFKTGFSGHLDHSDGSSRANYKVEVFSIDSNNSETKVYEATFDPSVAKDNDDMKITPAKDSTSRGQSFNIPKNNKEAALEEFAKDVYKPYATGGTFTAKNINLPAGSQAYKVRISSAENGKLGLDYHSNYAAYALPVTGLDFNIDQDTGAIAKDLLSRIYDKLKATETADIDGKTNETKAAYLAELENIKTLVTNTDVKKTAEYKVALESILSKQLALKVDKTGLTDSKASLDDLVKEDPTPGKTKDTATAYNAKKQDAIKAIEAAKTVIDSESATVAQVREALATVNAKKEALQQAKDGLIEAATAEEKAKLKADAAQLTKADETGKTSDSIAAYEAEYEKLKTQLEEAKSAAAAVEAKGDNASKTEAQEAQAKVDAAKTALDKAAESLVNKADKAELKTAKEALNTLATEADPTTGKTADSAKAYNDAKTAAQEAIKEAEAVISDENATQEKVTEALNKVNEKKKALDAAKQALVEAATAEEKAKLKADAAQLTKADETGKTPDSIAAYEAEYEKLKAQLEEAKATAAVVEAKGDNATKDEVKAAQAKVDAVKTALDKAAELLVNKADKAELTKAKEALSGLTTEADPTTGKTADSAKAYNDAKTAAQEAIKEAEAVISDENATQEKVTEALNKVNEKKKALDAAKQALVEAATAEEKAKLKADAAQLTKADETGKTPDSIAVYETEYEKLKTQLEEAKAAAAAVEAKGDNATKAEAQEAQAKVDAAKTALDKAAESLKNLDRDAAKKEIADAAKKATDTIEASTSLTPEQKAEEKAKIAKEAKDATDAIDNATTESGINSAKENGKLAIEKEAAISVINAEKAAKEQEIDNNTKLSDDEKAAAKAAVAKAATEAVEAIKNADTKDAVEAAKTKGEAAIKAVNPVGKEKALEAIQTAAEAKLAEIDKNDKLSAKEKAAAKAEVAKAAIEAVEAIQKAETQDAVDAAQVKGETAIKAVNPIGKEKALEAIQTTAEAKLAEIDKNTNLSAKEKAAAKAEVAKAAIEAVEAIQKAETQDAVDAAQVKGETAIKAVNPIGKEKALEAIQTTAEAKLAEIDKNTNLSAKEKAAAKAEVAKAAIEAVEAIQKAETQDAVDEAQAKGEATIKAVNPVGKEKALEAIKAIKEAKLAEIDKNTSLTADEKAAAKAAVEKAYNEAVEAIQKADTQEAVNDAQANGEAAIKAVNLIGKEKALEAIKATKEAKLAEIEKDTSLSADEKAAAKAAIEKAYNEAVEAIKKAETQEEVNAAQLKGEAAIKAVNTIGKEDVNEAKEAVKAAAAEKIASIKANPNLSAEEKEKAIAEVERLKQAALDAIDKATTKAALDKALRTFLYQLDQESLVYERPTFNLEAYIQASITGVVKVELGKAITQAEVISRLNLPENVTVISVDLPDTNTLGRKFAKVILRLPDGTEATVFVPVEVVESSEEYNQQNRQPNNTPVKPQEDAKPAEVPSDNSEQPAVNQTEDVKGNSSTTSQESKASNQKVLPNTGTGNEISIFGSAAMTVLASLGLVATSKKKEEE